MCLSCWCFFFVGTMTLIQIEFQLRKKKIPMISDRTTRRTDWTVQSADFIASVECFALRQSGSRFLSIRVYICRWAEDTCSACVPWKTRAKWGNAAEFNAAIFGLNAEYKGHTVDRLIPNILSSLRLILPRGLPYTTSISGMGTGLSTFLLWQELECGSCAQSLMGSKDAPRPIGVAPSPSVFGGGATRKSRGEVYCWPCDWLPPDGGWK